MVQNSHALRVLFKTRPALERQRHDDKRLHDSRYYKLKDIDQRVLAGETLVSSIYSQECSAALLLNHAQLTKPCHCMVYECA